VYSPALCGVLNSGGLLAGSVFTLDIDGVSNFRREAVFIFLEEPTPGVFGTIPSKLSRF
jgi:hypothetical protein